MKVALIVPNAKAARSLERALEGGEHSVAWTALKAADALRLSSADSPDVFIVSVALPDMRTSELTKKLLARGGCAVLLVARREDENISAVYEAMGAGALDVFVGPDESNADGSPMLTKLRSAARLLGLASDQKPASKKPATSQHPVPQGPPLIALGASTGGPQALLTVLSGLRRDTKAAIVIVQHVDEEFSEGLATWLSEGSGLPVELARVGSRPLAGTVLLASNRDHLVMTNGSAFRYTPEPRNLAYRPSVDVLFASLVNHWRGPGAAALLTGMGRDGAEGLRKLKSAGWLTLAQDEATSVVWGMPKAAVQLGAAVKVGSPATIAEELARFATDSSRAQGSRR